MSSPRMNKKEGWSNACVEVSNARSSVGIASIERDSVGRCMGKVGLFFVP